MVTPWVRHTPERALNRKLRKAGFAARGLDDAAICQVAYDDSDGFISEDTVEMLAVAHREKNWRKLAAVLVAEGRWTVAEGGWLIHDYEQFNMTKAYWEAERAKKQAAGRRGGKARGQASAVALAQAGASTHASAHAPPSFRAPVTPDGEADAQAASLRFVETSSSSSLLEAPMATPATEEGVERARTKIRAVAYQLAEQRLERRTPSADPVIDRPSWLRDVTERIILEEITPRFAELDLTAPVVTLVEQLTRRNTRTKRRPAQPDCATCDNHRRVIDDDGLARDCPTCTPARTG